MKHDMTTYKDKENGHIGMTADHTSRLNKVIFFADPHFLFFNFNAIAHCSHLLLPANAQTNLKAKAKESNRQPFIIFI